MQSVSETRELSDRLEVRLAESAAEIAAAQALRYRVFYQEMGAKPTQAMRDRLADFDDFDPVCDHLLVIDRTQGAGAAGVVGTYRLMRRAPGEAFGRFYTAGEYDISKILANGGRFMELGRSCVDSGYRNGGTMKKLWDGIAAYVFENGVELMFGCASLPGTDIEALAGHLSYLYHHHLAPESLRPRALPHLRVDMALRPKDALQPRRAMAELPPLIKGYLRLGGFVGDGAVIDHQFNTTDVCVMVKTDLVTAKYRAHYDRTIPGWSEE
ncbi:putative hemolysin [Paramagnetospirillum magnetotacticum MS-1]|uniref:L-ornithine N(alpha)-acyltransferase n=1 Tax=Paramagnetospirillum magnetotacticum MS-1 TaxID=272627 RepID=A0A0C2U8Y3_PARME|nr:GNAT family N-acyltransferase [Paramagnetospirillum magnetotacticum]KIL97952.1 putative hemolysin [Paramagnetospirillum magnetotacticum MS-1]